MKTDSIKKEIAKCIQYQSSWMSTASWIMSDISLIDDMEADDVKRTVALFSDIFRYNAHMISKLNELMEHMNMVGRKLKAKASAEKGRKDGNDCDRDADENDRLV